MHISNDGVLIEDPDGIELPDLDAARQEAIQSARDLLAEMLVKGETVDGQAFEVHDERGVRLATVMFKDAFKTG